MRNPFLLFYAIERQTYTGMEKCCAANLIFDQNHVDNIGDFVTRSANLPFAKMKTI